MTAVDADISTAATVGTALSGLFRLATRTKARLCAANPGVDWSDMIVLGPLVEGGPQRSSALAEAIHVDPSRASRMIAHLIDREFAERKADPTDGRVSIIAVTDAGRSRFAELAAMRTEFLATVLASWSERDRSKLATLLNRFVTDLAVAHETCPPPHSKMENA